MKPIIIKQVLDQDGAFTHLELHQGNNVIELSLASSKLDNQNASFKWDNLQPIIERIRVKANKEATEAVHGNNL